MNNKPFRRWTASVLAAVMAGTISVSSVLALPADGPFAEFRIDASGNDIQDRDISIALYRQNRNGQFQVADTVEYTCKLNRATGDASFFIQPQADDVWVTVDYLTDLDGDGTYELLDGEDSPVWDVMDPQGGLAQPQEGGAPTLTNGETYILSPEILVYRSKATVQDRTAGGTTPLDVGQGSIARQDFPLCMIKLHHTSPDDGQDSVQTYYLEIYDQVLIPFDITPDQWFYDAVKFVLAEGYFSGTSDGLFAPEEALTRAQLAQVLWTMGGSQNARMAQFSDVSAGSWYYNAVSWCQQEGLIAGYSTNVFAPNDPLTREQMISILFRYAKHSGRNLRTNGDLSQFSDGDSISPWAAESMRWAVSNSLLTNTEEGLRPQETVTRAELAAALYAYELNSSMG